MRTAVLAILIGLYTVSPVKAQPNDPAATTKDAGKVKIEVGLVLIGVGALIIPAASLGYPRPSGRTMSWVGGEGLIGAGITCVVLGARDRRRTLAPELTVGVTAWRGAGGVVVRRTW
jgi:hypothetical protein